MTPRQCFRCLPVLTVVLLSAAECFADTVAKPIPGPLAVILSDIFPWVALGAAGGYVLNVKSPNYEGTKPLLERHGFTRVSGWVTISLDLLFFVGLGPVLVTAMYAPEAVVQGATLGLGWPFMIRGAIASLQNGGKG